MTKREQIIQTIEALLTGISGVSDGSIYRSRAEAFAREEYPAIVIEPEEDVPTETSVGRLDWTLILHINVMVRDPIPDQAADPIVADVHNKIMSSADLDSLVTSVLPAKVQWQAITADQTLGIVSAPFKLEYQTDRNNLSA